MAEGRKDMVQKNGMLNDVRNITIYYYRTGIQNTHIYKSYNYTTHRIMVMVKNSVQNIYVNPITVIRLIVDFVNPIFNFQKRC